MNGGSLVSRMCVVSAVVVSLLGGGASAGPIIQVTEQTQVAIQRALDDLRGPGTVVLSPGAYEVDGTLMIRYNGVTLQGSGSDQTVLYRSVDGTHTAMVQATGHSLIRITGLAFIGASNFDPVSGELSNGREVGVLLENARDFRVDNSYFTKTGYAGVRVNGTSRGVVDHSTFEDLFKPRVNDYGYGVAVYGIDRLEGVGFGSNRATFIEDSSFSLCRHAVTANKAGRYVFRFNYVAQNQIAHAVDAHGAEFGSAVGTEWIDVHDNLIDAPIYDGYAVRIRSGKGLVWNNIFFDYRLGVRLTQATPAATGPVNIWDNYISPETRPMVRADAGVTFSLTRRNYTPYPYPHPLAQP